MYYECITSVSRNRYSHGPPLRQQKYLANLNFLAVLGKTMWFLKLARRSRGVDERSEERARRGPPWLGHAEAILAFGGGQIAILNKVLCVQGGPKVERSRGLEPLSESVTLWAV